MRIKCVRLEGRSRNQNKPSSLVSLLITGAHTLVTLRDSALQQSKGDILGMLSLVCGAAVSQLPRVLWHFLYQAKLSSNRIFLLEG